MTFQLRVSFDVLNGKSMIVLSLETKNIFSYDFIYSSCVGICEQLVPVNS